MDANQIVNVVVAALNQVRIPYMLAGSYSSNYYGVTRATRDADFVIQLKNQSIAALSSILGKEFLLDPQMSFETVTGTFRYVLSHPASKFKVEFFLLSDDAHDQARFERRRTATLNSQEIFLPTPEDVIITKLRWAKGGGRNKDIEDIEYVLSLQKPILDLSYIRQWTDQHQTRDLFEKLLAATPD